MDRERFDALARGLGTGRTRRSALAALTGVVLLGTAAADDAEGKKRKRRRRRRRKKNNQRVCFGTNACPPPESGKDLDDCDYTDSSVFEDVNAGGSSFRRSNFAGATMDGADLQGTTFLNANLSGASLLGVDVRGASFKGACLLNTDFTGFIFVGPVLEDAILCNTRVGAEVSNRDCANLPSCCRA